MSSFSNQLFEGQAIVLTALDAEKDPEVISRWTHDPEYLRMLETEPARPLSVGAVKKLYETLVKQSEEEKSLFHFTIHARPEPTVDEEGRLLGFIQLFWVDWTHGNADIKLAIGDPADRRKGYGREALQMMIRYAFWEINLYRLSAAIPEYNQAAMNLFESAGFTPEVRRRQALERYGRRWDMIHLSLFRQDWQPAKV